MRVSLIVGAMLGLYSLWSGLKAGAIKPLRPLQCNAIVLPTDSLKSLLVRASRTEIPITFAQKATAYVRNTTGQKFRLPALS
jgi:hypothetical protein